MINLMTVNLNKSHLQEVPLGSGMGPLPHRLRGGSLRRCLEHLLPFLPFLSPHCLQGCFSHFFFPHSSPVAAFCPFLNAFSAKGLCSARPQGCRGSIRNHLELGGQHLSPRRGLSPTPRHNAALSRIVLAKDVLREPNFPSGCLVSGRFLPLGPARGRRVEAGEPVGLRRQPGFRGGKSLPIFLTKVRLQTVKTLLHVVKLVV